MRKIDRLLSEYGESHQNVTNKTIHWICVPAIFFSVTGLLYGIRIPASLSFGWQLNAAMIALLLTTLYYFLLSVKIGIGMLLFGMANLALCYAAQRLIPVPLWLLCIVIFILAWIGQFYGHNIEGKKPSFFKDIQFLLIGPMWLMSFVYQKIGVRY